MAKFSGFSKEYLGLSKIEIEESKRKFGANELFEKPKLNLFEKLILALSEPMFLLLFGAAFIYFILGEYKDGIIMFFFICIIFGIDFYQEWKTGNVLEELKELSSPQIRVIRDGKLETISSTEIVVKDIIIIEEGEKVPIDGKVLEMFDLGVDESLLTGESDIVWKKLFSDIYAGSIVIQGSAVVEVLSVGKSTQIGKIGLELTDMKSDSETLEKKTRKLVKIIGSISGILCIFIFFLNFYKTENFTESLLLAITLAMTGIPEDFPVILTVFLAMGAWRLAKKNALVRSVPVVEVLGRVTVLCVDKTGTLTKNKMTLKELKPDKKISEKEFIYWSSLACETEPYDPMEKSILLKAVDFGLNKDEIFKYPLLEEYPFNPENKYMGHLWEISNEICLAVKGSPESVIPLCYLSENDKNNFIVEYENLSKKGYRVLAVARKRNLEKIPIKIKEVQLELIGLLGFMDPPRESVIEAIETCKKSGIRVVMITGDSDYTAKTIGKMIKMENWDKSVTGNEIEKLSDNQLENLIKEIAIFSRVMPKHKLRIVNAFKKNGEVVAMTGDGVNDATALKAADIGIAMGKKGTGVAKEAASMILLDDKFSTIIETVEDGRRIFENIQKSIGYVIAIHIPIMLMVLMGPIFNIPIILTPANVALLEIIIVPTCSIIFERLPSENNLMDHPPRTNSDSLIGSTLVLKSIFQGMGIFVITFLSYLWFIKNGHKVEYARSFILILISVSSMVLVYVNYSDSTSAIKSFISISRDKVIWIINIFLILIMLFMIYTNIGNGIAQTCPLSFLELISAVLLALPTGLWWELKKQSLF